MKRRFLAWMTAICLLTMLVVPIGGTWATEELTTEAPTGALAENSEPTQTPAPKDEPTAPSEPEPPAEQQEAEQSAAPVNTESPATETPATEAPATGAPAMEAPATNVPATDAPATEAPATEVPATDVPVTEAPTTDAPATDAPATEIPTEAPTAEPTAAPESDLSIELGSAPLYAFANEDTVNVPVSLTGSYGPFAVSLRVTCGDGAVYETSATAETVGSASFSYMPTSGGEHIFTVTVTDATGAAKSAEVRVPVAVREEETRAQWEKTFENVQLTGNWRENIINIARTQLGYEESDVNFIVSDDGKAHGYTRYGDWYGSSYGEWCAMFVSFCLNYADIPASAFPREANSAKWKSALNSYGAYEDDENAYTPIPGDLIFFNWENENKPQHVGIVESVSDDTVYTIEGNSYGSVRRCQYSLKSGDIVGYGSIAALMARAGLDENGEPLVIEGDPVAIPENVKTAATTTENVNVRTQPSTVTACVTYIAEAGTIVELLSAESVDGQVWYYVKANESAGYIRGDLLELIELEQETLVPVMNVTVQPESAAWRPGMPDIEFTFSVEEAAGYTWQQSAVNESGETVWTDIPGATESAVRIPADMESLKHSYRCVAVDSAGYTAVSDEVTMIEKTLADWMNAAEVSEEMLVRALNAGDLELLVLEGDRLVYVRTGEVIAHYNRETGYIVDDETGLIVAYIDETGAIVPVQVNGAE